MEPTNLNGPLFESFFWIQAAPLHAKAAALASAAPPKPARDKGGKDGTAAVKVKSPTNLVPQVLWHYPEDVSRIAAEFRDIPQFCFPGIAASHLPCRATQLLVSHLYRSGPHATGELRGGQAGALRLHDDRQQGPPHVRGVSARPIQRRGRGAQVG